MPIYEYKCKKCGSTFEAMQKISAEPLKKCEINGCKGKVQRLISASGFILKGSGWYATDYPSESRKEGWESENKQNKTENADNATGETDKKAPTASAESAPDKSPAKKAPELAKKSAAKNPYSSGSKKKFKSAK